MSTRVQLGLGRSGVPTTGCVRLRLRSTGRKLCRPVQAVLSKDQRDLFYQKGAPYLSCWAKEGVAALRNTYGLSRTLRAGYLVLDDFASPAEVKAMMDSSDDMLSSYKPDEATVYSVSGNVCKRPGSAAPAAPSCRLYC